MKVSSVYEAQPDRTCSSQRIPAKNGNDPHGHTEARSSVSQT